jgi:hypothetical protein
MKNDITLFDPIQVGDPVGIDGGYVRIAHKQGWFEVIAGKSTVAFRREEDAKVADAFILLGLGLRCRTLSACRLGRSSTVPDDEPLPL